MKPKNDVDLWVELAPENNSGRNAEDGELLQVAGRGAGNLCEKR